MKSNNSLVLFLGIVFLISLEACSNSNQAGNPETSPTSASPASSLTQPDGGAKTEQSSQANVPQQGGQVVESGSYHLEFVPEKEDNGTHLDFYLQTGNNHQAIPNAKVTAQIQLPDGTQKTLPLSYDTGGKHYTALLPVKGAGQYQVKINSDIKGEKVDGRFSFSQ